MIVLVAVGIARAVDVPDDTFARLAQADRFAFGFSGYAGVISRAQKDYETIRLRKSAEADFERLYSQGNLQAKCYALVGLYGFNPKRFRELAAASKESGKVVTQNGCIVYRESFASVLRRIATGQYSR